jgi:hypothetical protein
MATHDLTSSKGKEQMATHTRDFLATASVDQLEYIRDCLITAFERLDLAGAAMGVTRVGFAYDMRSPDNPLQVSCLMSAWGSVGILLGEVKSLLAGGPGFPDRTSS